MTLDRPRLAFLFDVDNTLLDNDRVKRDLTSASERLLGPARARRFWELYEDVRRSADYVDLPRTLRRFTREFPDEPGYPMLAHVVLSYPHGNAVYPGAHDVLRSLAAVVPVGILSDGDPVYQPAKIARAGIADDINGPILVFAHKQDNLDKVQSRIPAERYVLVDDKPSILETIHERMGDRVTTLHVCQGRYAHADEHETCAPADHEVAAVADILGLDLATL